MKNKTNFTILLMYTAIWISVSIAVSIGIYVTKSAMPLWTFILLPWGNIKSE